MLPDFVVKQIANFVGSKIGGATWGTVAAEAVAISVTEAEFINLYNRLENGSATQADVFGAVAAFEAALLGAGLVLTQAGIIAGVGASAPLVVAVVAAAGAAVWYHRNDVAIHDALDEMSDSISRGQQPWDFLPKMWEAYGRSAYKRAVSSAIGNTPDPEVTTIDWIPVVDPLIVDLDGDGLEIKGLDAGAEVLFDTDADGIRTATAWVASDDGLLVLDRNGNGLIDDGSELFGDETLLANGQKAAHGFAALAELDTNRDGAFSAADTAFGAVRVWRDLNQDGISQADELRSLGDSGVSSVQLASTATDVDYADATLVQTGTFTRADGSAGQAGSFLLAQNHFVTEHTSVDVSDVAAALPAIGGSGWVRDLQGAATLSPGLIDRVHAVQDADTRAAYKAAVGDLLVGWAGASDYVDAAEDGLAQGYGVIMRDPRDAQEAGWLDMAVKADAGTRDAFRSTLSVEDLAKFDVMREEMVGALERLAAYEAFTGFTFLDWAKIYRDAFGPPTLYPAPDGVPITVQMPFSRLVAEHRIAWPSGQDGYVRVTFPPPVNGTPHVESLWTRLLDDASQNLLPTLRLAPYAEMVDLVIGDAGITLDFTRLDAALASANADNLLEGRTLLIDLHRAYGGQFDALGWTGGAQLRTLLQLGASDAGARSAFTQAGYAFSTGGTTNGSATDDAFAGTASANSFSAGAGDDLLTGGDGSDTLSASFGNDMLFGDSGNDSMDGGDGHDTLDGGAGNDTIKGGLGDNTYLFGRGDGSDYIATFQDTSATKSSVLRFKAGVAPSDIVARQVSSPSFNWRADLELSIAGTTDKITISGGWREASGAAADYTTVQRFEFADGTVWTVADIKALLFAGTAGADTIDGSSSADTISGAAGNDILSGLVGNDVLRGSDGNDSLDGGVGNDTLDGGAGKDTIKGGLGDNTYLFGRGDGSDYIATFQDTSTTKNSVLRFKPGVIPADIVARQVSSPSFNWRADLELSIAGTADKATISGGWREASGAAADYTTVQRFEFADGTVWTMADVKALLFAGTTAADTIDGTSSADTISGAAGNDVLSGLAGNDVLRGGDGNDTIAGVTEDDALFGEAGNDSMDGGVGSDVLDGGTGNDTIKGGLGDNTYLFGRSDGADYIATFQDTSAAKNSVLRFQAGVAPTDIVARQVYSPSFNWNADLELSIAGTTDKITISGGWREASGAAADYSTVQRFEFADGTVWTMADIKAKLFAGTTGADSIGGTSSADTISGAAGNDSITGNLGNDVLDGGSGNDTLKGGAGDDVCLVDSMSDIVSELTGEGNDEVRSSVTRTLEANVENLTLTGSATVNGTGNTLANVLNGNAGANALAGGEGNDTYDGAAGADVLNDVSTTSSDVYRWGIGSGLDTLTDAGGASDRIDLGQGISAGNLRFAQSGTHLVVSVLGQSDRLTINNWFASPNQQIESFRCGDGSSILSTEVQALVGAMAVFGAAEAAVETSPASGGVHAMRRTPDLLMPSSAL